jgi:hypothetical protein
LARTTRAIGGVYRKPIARISTGSPRPNTATSTAASAMPGNAMTTSRIRMMIPSTRRFEVAATAPITAPATSAIATAPRPTASDQRAP